jgi:Ni/Co efflux regulator RcnB
VPAYYDGQVVYAELDADRDGIPDQLDNRDDRYTNWGSIIRYDRYGHPLTARQVDRDCDGLIDRYDYSDRPYPRNLDCYSNRVGTVTVGAVAPVYVEPAYVEPAGYVRYGIGANLPAAYMDDDYYVDYQTYGLAAPPDGYHWNRVGNDVYLVSYDGLIVDVRYDLFH